MIYYKTSKTEIPRISGEGQMQNILVVNGNSIMNRFPKMFMLLQVFSNHWNSATVPNVSSPNSQLNDILGDASNSRNNNGDEKFDPNACSVR